jgi:hypothetical protein
MKNTVITVFVLGITAFICLGACDHTQKNDPVDSAGANDFSLSYAGLDSTSLYHFEDVLNTAVERIMIITDHAIRQDSVINVLIDRMNKLQGDNAKLNAVLQATIDAQPVDIKRIIWNKADKYFEHK